MAVRTTMYTHRSVGGRKRFCRCKDRARLALVALFLLVPVACQSVTLSPAPDAQIRREADAVTDPQELVVLVDSPSAASNLERRARRHGLRLTSRERMDGLGTTMLIFRIPKGMSGAEAIELTESLEAGAIAGVNHRYRLQEQLQEGIRGRSDAGRADYANAMIHWPPDGCTAFRTVGMIDSAIGTARVAADGAAIVEQRLFKGSGQGALPVSAASNAAGLSTGHGTAIARLLVGPGRLRQTTLYSAAVIGDDADGSTGVDTLVRAIDWLAGKNVSVVNISLAGPYNKILDVGIQRGLKRGMVFVAAGGNDGPQAPPRYPAALPGVIAVTAVDVRGMAYTGAVRGDHIDVAAPGVDVAVEIDGTRRFMTGTSIAAPFVTALIAAEARAMAEDGGALSPKTVRRHIASSAGDLGLPGKDPTFGHGLIRTTDACRGVTGNPNSS